MIAQVLNREFILQQVSAIKLDLERASREDASVRRGDPSQTSKLEREDYNRAFELIKQTEAAFPQGQPGFQQLQGGRRAAKTETLDDHSFLSRDPVVSLVQTAIELYYTKKRPDALERISATSGRRGAAAADTVVTDLSIKGGFSSQGSGRRILDQFSITDIRWVSSLVAEGIRFFRGKHVFNEKPATPVTIGESARVLLVGDWGTGLPRAKKVSAQMRKVLDKGKGEGREQHVIHLGDVYYSGWKDEYLERFLAPDCWPVQPAEADSITSWSLNGNHDMYSGGHAYYDVLLTDPRFERQERSSYFSLSNNHWDILGLDTSWEDEALSDPQAAWVATTIGQSQRKTMLLTHHQIFSAYDSACPNVEKKLHDVLAAQRVRAWFWGHEHRCMLFNPHQNVEYARCLGHGGVPVYMTHDENDPYPVPGAYEYRAFIRRALESWALFGFAVLEFDGPKIAVRYIDENGTEHKREEIS